MAEPEPSPWLDAAILVASSPYFIVTMCVVGVVAIHFWFNRPRRR